MEFPNKQNTPHVGEDGVTRWHSRAIAVSAVIVSEDDHVLITQRSATMQHHPNKWCIPCGYLDWNESIHQALIREVFEEVGINIDGLRCMMYHISDDPNRDELQNVSFHFMVGVPQKHDEVVLDISEEVQAAEWVSIKDIQAENYGDKEFAFNHRFRLRILADGPMGFAEDGYAEHETVLDLTEKSQFKF